MTKAKLWNDGRGVYTKGLAVLAKRKKDRSTALHGAEEVPSSTTEEAEIRKENALEEACYVNRALCNLELSKPSNLW